MMPPRSAPGGIAAPFEHMMPPRSAPGGIAAPFEHMMPPPRAAPGGIAAPRTYENMLMHLAEAAYLRVMLGRGGGRGKKNAVRGVSNSREQRLCDLCKKMDKRRCLALHAELHLAEQSTDDLELSIGRVKISLF
jgi:hypothetical protein